MTDSAWLTGLPNDSAWHTGMPNGSAWLCLENPTGRREACILDMDFPCKISEQTTYSFPAQLISRR